MEFIFECYIDIERVSAANEWDIECEHEKINSISPSVHVLFCLLYKLTDDGGFDDFPKISDNFPKISEDFQNCSEGQTNVPEHFPWISENSRRCPKIPEDSRRLLRKIRRCFDDTPTNLSTIEETKLISEKLSISSHVKLSWFYMSKYMDFLSGRNPNKTLVFIAGSRRARNLVCTPYLDFGGNLFCQNRSINPRKPIRSHFHSNKIF